MAQRSKNTCLVCDLPGILRCSRCKDTRFCTREHQKLAWKEHKKWCRVKEEDNKNEQEEEEETVVGYPKEPVVDVFQHVHRFVHPKKLAGNASGSLLFSANRPLPPKAGGKKKGKNKLPTINASIAEFLRRFHGFSSGLFTDMPPELFQNVLVAGGAVLACLLPEPRNFAELQSLEYQEAVLNQDHPKWNKPDPLAHFFPQETRSHDPHWKPRSLEQYFEITRWNGADVDIFIHGLNKEAATAKLAALFRFLSSKLPKGADVAFVRTTNTVTMVSGDPRRHIQVIVRTYPDAAAILNGFDLDCCCCGFDGSRVWATPRAIEAINTRVNVINLNIRGPFYEERLIKYAARGFAVSVLGLERSRVNKDVVLRVKRNSSGYGGGFDFDSRDLWYSARYLERLLLAQDAFRLVSDTRFNPFPCRLEACRDIISPDSVYRVKVANPVKDGYPHSRSVGSQDQFTHFGVLELDALLPELAWQRGSMEKQPMTFEDWCIYCYEGDPRTPERRYAVTCGDGGRYAEERQERLASAERERKAAEREAEARRRQELADAMEEARAELRAGQEVRRRELAARAGQEQQAYEAHQIAQLQAKHEQELQEAEERFHAEAEEDASMCVVCFDAAKDTIFHPCKHVCACHACAIRLKICPMCRGLVKNAHKIFL